jgi:shikimate dehydrogenase/3-dehydroquinate dehydratase type I
MRTCVAVAEKDIGPALVACRSAKERGADLLEVRFDRMEHLPADLSPFRVIELPKIATLRSVGQGGSYSGADDVKVEFLVRAVQAGFDHIDIELDFPLLAETLRRAGNAKVIVSHHNFESTPEISAMVQMLVRCGSKGDVAKVAYHANGPGDVLSFVEAAKAYRETGNEFIAISMGERGAVTRACHERIGSSFTYASLESGRETAAGQIDLASLKRLEGDVIITGVTGRSLSHSLSPWMHNAAYRSLDLPGRYFKFPAEQEELPDLLDLIIALDIRGTNVTIPHKEAILPLLDRIDPEAERIGAVNTVKNESGELVGYNTDVHGVEMTFKLADLDPRDRNVLVMGAGGAARSVCAFLSKKHANTYLANRTMGKAMALADRFDHVTAIGPEVIGLMRFDAIVNCTPLGMKGYPDEISVPVEALRPGQFVMDTIYNPPRTKLLQAAEACGANAVSGRDMLIFQAMKAFEIWTGRIPPYEVMAQGFQEGMSR